MDDVVPAQLLEPFSQLLQEVPRGGLRDLPVALNVVAQVATSAELQHNEEPVVVLQMQGGHMQPEGDASASISSNLFY
jgi:hypothetical protein